VNFVDTSVLVRYLTGDPPTMLEAAKRIIDIDNSDDLIITDVVLAETAFVLTSFYKVPRTATVDSLIELIQKKTIKLLNVDKNIAIQALLLCRPSARVSFADALIWAVARSQGNSTVYSFDERFPNEGITLKSS
jgi:predicted nucleic acid-binding protein